LIVKIEEIDVSKFSHEELCDFWKNTWSKIQLKGKITVVTEKGVIELVKKDYIKN
jgi:hypothetical protein